MIEGMNSTMIYCKNFVNVTIYPQYNNNMIITSYMLVSEINKNSLTAYYIFLVDPVGSGYLRQMSK
jgi:hypothetical protein